MARGSSGSASTCRRRTLETRGVWRVVPESVLAGLGLVPERWPGVLHAAEHAAIGVLPLFAICDRWDVGGVSTARHVDTGEPTIVIYDGYPGGAGHRRARLRGGRAAPGATTAQVIAACACRAGCPSCVQSPKCGNGNEPLDKDGALLLLAALTGVELPPVRANAPDRPTTATPRPRPRRVRPPDSSGVENGGSELLGEPVEVEHVAGPAEEHQGAGDRDEQAGPLGLGRG